MSDFLSNFTKNNYDGQKKEPAEKQPAETAAEVTEEQPIESETVHEPVEEQVAEPQATRSQRATVSRFQTEETEFDPTYKKRQRRKYVIIAIVSVLAALLLYFVYYQLTHVSVPNFAEKEISEVRAWGNDEGVLVEVDQKYDFDTEVNYVISQAVKPGKKIKKGKTLTIKGSLGADPEDKLELPEFKSLDKEAAREWITENKAENVSLIEAFDDKVKKNEFIKLEKPNKELKLEEYRRKDRLMVYYSKGKEVFEKDIEVPDFKGKLEAEVSEWAKKNNVKLKIVKEFSSSVPVGTVLSQETSKGTKIAQQSEFVVQLSKGKAITVPDYSKYTMAEASGLGSKIPVVIKNIYTSDVGYGQFISQSVEAGKEYTEGDNIPTIEVVYSEGRPYIKDLRGSTQEGDLPKIFFDEYQSKGAYIYYSTYYVDSYEPKGTVVEMSQYGQYLPLETTIYIGISLGNLEPPKDAEPRLPQQDSAEEAPAAAAEKPIENATEDSAALIDQQ